MNSYVLRILTGKGTFFDDVFVANSFGAAKMIAEARYGAGCVQGIISETYLG